MSAMLKLTALPCLYQRSKVGFTRLRKARECINIRRKHSYGVNFT
jgi:hypothetical protein